MNDIDKIPLDTKEQSIYETKWHALYRNVSAMKIVQRIIGAAGMIILVMLVLSDYFIYYR